MTNPTPVAPKTDTPATQIPEHYDLHRQLEEEWLATKPGTSFKYWLIERITNLESTLAAERASRNQAEDALKEASDALIAYQFQPLARILRARRVIDGALAKPSVSPEQAEETT